MRLRVINGGRRKLENRVIKNMLRGEVCSNDLDKLKPWGNLTLVGSNAKPQSSDSEESSTHHSEDSVSG